MSLVISPSLGSVLPRVDAPLNRGLIGSPPDRPRLGLHTSAASSMGFVPAGGTKISQATWHGQKINKTGLDIVRLPSSTSQFTCYELSNLCDKEKSLTELGLCFDPAAKPGRKSDPCEKRRNGS